MKKLLIFIFILNSLCFPEEFVKKKSGISLFGIGSNYLGTLGSGVNGRFDFPVQTLNISDVVKVSAGAYHTIALKSDGTVWAWGDNVYGQLGDKTIVSKPYPVQVLGLSDIIDISAGTFHSLALKRDGTVWGWGFNNYDYPLGLPLEYIRCDRDGFYICAPAKLYGMDNVRAISAGHFYSLFLKNDGTVWGLGNNEYGQLGHQNGRDSYYSPVKVPDIKNVIKISAGVVHSMALKNDGTVWAWGLNSNGELGDGTYEDSSFPVKVKNLSDVIQISAGEFFSLALRNDGTVWAWGDNYSGNLGNGTEKNDTNKPQMVQNLYGIKDISAGRHGCVALESDGDVWTWGWMVGYALENGSYKNVLTPLKIIEKSDIKKVFMGKLHQLFLKEDGTILGRMDNYSGQLGIGYFGYNPEPEVVETIDDLVQVSGGYLFSLGLKADGTVWSWGYNYYGQLGNGKTWEELLYSLVPVQVLNLEDVVQVSAGSEFGLALKRDGTVWAWGLNSSGQLGDGTNNSSNFPVKVKDLENVIAISAGHFHSLALKEDGTVWAWGYGGYGILGNGKLESSNVPVQVKNLNNIISISAGEIHSLALKNDGTLWYWGGYDWFEWQNNPLPFQMEGLENVISISAGAYHCLVLKEDGTVWGWGLNNRGELTNWKFIHDVYPPKKIEGIPKIKGVYAGNFFSMVEDEEGKLWAFGNNLNGQLGIGYRSSLVVDTPTEVLNLKNPLSLSLGGFHALALKMIEKNKF